MKKKPLPSSNLPELEMRENTEVSGAGVYRTLHGCISVHGTRIGECVDERRREKECGTLKSYPVTLDEIRHRGRLSGIFGTLGISLYFLFLTRDSSFLLGLKTTFDHAKNDHLS